jgi:bifunctional non-homologous end joining protein LigD
VKCLNRQEFVIGGWMESEAEGRSLRSLLLGYYKGGQLIYAGKVCSRRRPGIA